MNPQPATINTPRPSGMGLTCDAIYQNPAYSPDGDAPLLMHCKAPAVIKIRYRDSDGKQAVAKRCPVCRDVLKAKRGIEILAEEAL